jgi:hypothetical protein
VSGFKGIFKLDDGINQLHRDLLRKDHCFPLMLTLSLMMEHVDDHFALKNRRKQIQKQRNCSQQRLSDVDFKNRLYSTFSI